jgi:hypothetical protein
MKIRPFCRFSTLTGYFHRRTRRTQHGRARNQKGPIVSFHDFRCSIRARSPVRGDMFVKPIATLFERAPLGVRPVCSTSTVCGM